MLNIISSYIKSIALHAMQALRRGNGIAQPILDPSTSPLGRRTSAHCHLFLCTFTYYTITFTIQYKQDLRITGIVADCAKLPSPVPFTIIQNELYTFSCSNF
jgi:hypothetical protein